MAEVLIKVVMKRVSTLHCHQTEIVVIPQVNTLPHEQLPRQIEPDAR